MYWLPKTSLVAIGYADGSCVIWDSETRTQSSTLTYISQTSSPSLVIDSEMSKEVTSSASRPVSRFLFQKLDDTNGMNVSNSLGTVSMPIADLILVSRNIDDLSRFIRPNSCTYTLSVQC